MVDDDELFPDLPDEESGSRLPMPYKHRAERTLHWLKDNCLPIAGIILAMVLV